MRALNCPFEVKELSDSGSFEGLASVYGELDLSGDVVLPGAFKEFKLTKDGQIRILDNHNTRTPVGKGFLTDTHIGLAIKGKLNLSISYARNVYELMKDGITDGLSIGYDTLPGGSEIKDGKRYLSKLLLWEVSTTVFPMCESALVSNVKSMPTFDTIRGAEAWLRDELDLTNSAAKEFVARFRKSIVGARDEPARDEPISEDVQSYLNFLNSLTENPK